jgi:hypothetical protein
VRCSDDGVPPRRVSVVPVEYESLLVLLAARSAPPDAGALETLHGIHIVWLRLEREGQSVCLAARVRHRDRPDDFRARVRGWGADRGWAVTVAPAAPPL